MSQPRSAERIRRRRTAEAGLLLALVAGLALMLTPIAREKARQRAEQKARAQAMLDQANSMVSKVGRLTPAVIGFTYSAARGAPLDELMEKMAPIELETVNEQLAKEPNNVELLQERARLHELAGNPQARLTDLSRILTLSPDDLWVRQQRRDQYVALGLYPQACNDAEMLDRELIGDWTNGTSLVRIYIGTGRYQEAGAVLARLQREGYEQDAELLWLEAAALRGQGQEKAALAAQSRSRKLDPSYCLHWKVADDPGHHPGPCLSRPHSGWE